MAVNIPILTSFGDTGIKKASAAFNTFKADVANAEGGMDKFKAGSKSALDSVKANAGAFAMAAGAAIVGFGIQAIGAFQDLALAAGKFSDATGLSVEEASRFIEVAGDIGIEAGVIETAIGKVNKVLGVSPELFEELGVQVVYANDGTVDANETFLNTIDRLNKIKDPAEKAKVAAQLLGKGWQSMSELIAGGSDKLRASLADVSDSKIIDEKELAKAKEFRASMDAFGEAVQDVTLAIGQFLVPVVTVLADKITAVTGSGDGKNSNAVKFFGYLTDAAELTTNIMVNGPIAAFQSYGQEEAKAETATDNFRQAARDAAAEATGFKTEINKAKYGLGEFKTTADLATVAVQNVDVAWQTLTGRLDSTVALNNAKTQLDAVKEAAAKALSTGDVAAYDEAIADLVGKISALSTGLSNIDSQEVKVLVDTGRLEQAIAYIQYIKRGGELGGLTQQQLLDRSGLTIPITGRRAMGGMVSSGGTYLVGERGPELLTMGGQSGTITANGAGGGNNVTINVNGGDPQQVVNALRRYMQLNGSVPIRVS